MNLEKLHGALAQMSAALEDKSGPKGPAQPPVQPGQMMWNAGIYYFADAFTYESTKPVVNWIIEKNLLPDSERPKELTLIINSPGGSVHAA